MRAILFKSLSALIVLSFLFAPAQLGAQLDCTAGDVYAFTSPYPGSTTATAPYTDCFGAIQGNNEPVSKAIGLIYDNFDLNWTEEDNYLGKNEAGGVEEIFNDPGTWGTSGDLWLKDPYTGSFVLALKGGNYFSMYYFPDLGATTYGFHYDMAGVSEGKENFNALSHASVYNGDGGSVVPEPATILLLGTGLLGVGVVGYRRRKNS